MGAQVAMTTMRVGPKGRVVIPQGVREALGIREGDTVLIRVEDGRAVLETWEAVERELFALVDQVAGGRSLSDELLAERRAEARREAEA